MLKSTWLEPFAVKLFEQSMKSSELVAPELWIYVYEWSFGKK
jgi:hypothetical protein